MPRSENISLASARRKQRSDIFSETLDIYGPTATRWEGRIIGVSSLRGQCVTTNSIQVGGCAIDGIVTLFPSVLQTAGSGV